MSSSNNSSASNMTMEQRVQLLVNAVTDYAIYMLDVDGRVSNWNAGAEVIKGYAADEIIGQHFSRFYTADDQARGEPAFALETALREGRYEREAQRVRKDGSLFWASVVIDPIYDDGGALLGFAKITRDITERRKVQDQLEEARAALFQSQKLQALGELTGGIAHDFNNLMTVIRGSAELLRRDDLTPARHAKYVDAIIDTADRAITLTDRLLTFGRRQSLHLEVIDLRIRLDAFTEMLSRTLGSQISVVTDVRPNLWMVEVDSSELETALLNAAFNARDAMPDGGTLTISARNVEEEDAICIAVADTGEGISRETLLRVFEPFFTTKPAGKGTGLGLSQIHGFAAQIGGHADIQSVVGEGTRVSLTLPRSTKPLAVVALARQSEPEWSGLSILLVEDNAHVRAFARSLLQEMSCTVTEASTAEEAIARVGDGQYDLVFSDIVMPGMSGLQLARRLRQSMPGQRVLLATGYSKELVGAGGAAFPILQKPYGIGSLTAATSAVMAG